MIRALGLLPPMIVNIMLPNQQIVSLALKIIMFLPHYVQIFVQT